MQAFLNRLKSINWRALLCMFGVAIAGLFAVQYGRLIWLDGLFLPPNFLVLAILLVMLPLLFATFHGTRMENGERWKRAVILTVLYFAFAYYLFLLYCFLFAGGRADYDYSYNPVNWIPFQKVFAHFANGDSVGNLVFLAWGYLKNAALFFPLGFLLPFAVKHMKHLYWVTMVSILLILAVELVQHWTHTGFFDVDDIMCNLLGVLCGYGISRLYIVQEILRFVTDSPRHRPAEPHR